MDTTEQLATKPVFITKLTT